MKCEYNLNNGFIEVHYKNGNILLLKCEEIESKLRLSEHSQRKIWKLLEEQPIKYISMALSGETQAYCDIEDEMIKNSHDLMLQRYLERGYNKATAEAMIREFYRYDS